MAYSQLMRDPGGGLILLDKGPRGWPHDEHPLHAHGLRGAQTRVDVMQVDHPFQHHHEPPRALIGGKRNGYCNGYQ